MNSKTEMVVVSTLYPVIKKAFFCGIAKRKSFFSFLRSVELTLELNALPASRLWFTPSCSIVAESRDIGSGSRQWHLGEAKTNSLSASKIVRN